MSADNNNHGLHEVDVIIDTDGSLKVIGIPREYNYRFTLISLFVASIVLAFGLIVLKIYVDHHFNDLRKHDAQQLNEATTNDARQLNEAITNINRSRTQARTDIDKRQRELEERITALNYTTVNAMCTFLHSNPPIPKSSITPRLMVLATQLGCPLTVVGPAAPHS